MEIQKYFSYFLQKFRAHILLCISLVQLLAILHKRQVDKSIQSSSATDKSSWRARFWVFFFYYIPTLFNRFSITKNNVTPRGSATLPWSSSWSQTLNTSSILASLFWIVCFHMETLLLARLVVFTDKQKFYIENVLEFKKTHENKICSRILSHWTLLITIGYWLIKYGLKCWATSWYFKNVLSRWPFVVNYIFSCHYIQSFEELCT